MFNYMKKLLFSKENIREDKREMEYNSEITQRDIKQITKEINILDSAFRDMQYNYNAERSKLKYELNRCLFSNVNGLITKPKEYLFSDGVFDCLDDMSVFIKVKGEGRYHLKDKTKLETGEKQVIFESFIGDEVLYRFYPSNTTQVALCESLMDDFLSSEGFIAMELYVGQGDKSFKKCDLVWVNTRDY